MFDGEHKRPFTEFIEEAIAEANYYFGYGRYLRKHVDLSDPWFEEHYENGMSLVKDANAIKEALRVISNEIDDLDKSWNKQRADNQQWTEAERDKARKSYEKKLQKIQKQFAGEALRVVWLREPMDEVLEALELKPRRKYQRKPEEEPAPSGY